MGACTLERLLRRVLDLVVLHQLVIQDLIAAFRHGHRPACASLEGPTWP